MSIEKRLSKTKIDLKDSCIFAGKIFFFLLGIEGACI